MFNLRYLTMAGSAMIVAICWLCSSLAYADRADDFEFTLIIPYAYGEEVDFDGGASIDINDDPGFGFGFAYNYSDRFALRGDLTWNSVSYDAIRILDDGNFTRDRWGGDLDVFAMTFGGDFYLTTGKIAPFVNLNMGWANVDTNIADGPGSSYCWWDPWWGYMCSYYQSTYNKDSWFYGAGVGIRFDLSRNNFIRAGYYQRWMDFDNADSSNAFSGLRFEFGFSY